MNKYYSSVPIFDLTLTSNQSKQSAKLHLQAATTMTTNN